MTEREKMIAGEPYNGQDPDLLQLRDRARRLVNAFNRSAPLEREPMTGLLRALIRDVGARVFIEVPFHCAYGFNISLGEHVYLNTACSILDCAPVRIGAHTQIGPAVQIYTAQHAHDAPARAQHQEFADPVTIGRNVWIGGGAIVCPGVTIGDAAIIGAGSVVVRDIPGGVTAVGNPCRVVGPSTNGPNTNEGAPT